MKSTSISNDINDSTKNKSNKDPTLASNIKCYSSIKNKNAYNDKVKSKVAISLDKNNIYNNNDIKFFNKIKCKTNNTFKIYNYSFNNISEINCNPVMITESIYQGDINSAANKECLSNLKITHIISAVKTNISFDNTFVVKHFKLEDTYKENIYKYFQECFDFIDTCVNKKNSKILIHCVAGISRSSALILCYFIKKYKLNYEKAFNLLKKVNPIVYPNLGFQLQLCDWYDREVRVNQINN